MPRMSADDQLAQAILDEVRKWLDDYRPDLGRAIGRLTSIGQLPPGGDYYPDGDTDPDPNPSPDEGTPEEYQLHLAAGEGITLTPDTTALTLTIAATGGGGGEIPPPPDTYSYVTYLGAYVTYNGAYVYLETS